MSLLRYYHTLKYLRREQIVGRLRLRFAKPKLSRQPAPPLRAALGAWVASPRRPEKWLGESRFRFLNDERTLEFPRDWNNAAIPRLWLYNLHYFDYLRSEPAPGRQEARALIGRWLAHNVWPSSAGWESFPTSLRIINWITWLREGGTLGPLALDSLAWQLRWLEQRLEYHLLGNHLLANAVALCAGGLFFDGPEAARWFERGASLLAGQLPEQVLADGGQYERSAMYQSAVIEQFLDLVNLLKAAGSNAPRGAAEVQQQLVSRLPAMLAWLTAMTHRNGRPAFFNDAAEGITPSCSALRDYAARLGIEPTASAGAVWLRESGYVRLERGPASLFIDAAPLGPDYLPGHAHADTLSFELSLGTHDLIVNSGTSTYEAGMLREWQRSTAAHSTLEIARQNSSEVWSAFRVARRARVAVSPDSLRRDEDVDEFTAEHDGYTRLARGLVHRRRWWLSAGRLEVLDTLGVAQAEVIARFYLHPAVKVDRPVPGTYDEIPFRDGEFRGIVRAAGQAIELDASQYFPEFGQSQANLCLKVRAVNVPIVFEWST